MKNKPADRAYMGLEVNVEKIKNANPIINPEMLKLYVWYQWERTNIYYKKEILKKKPPFTKDIILQNVSFTNTRRELDRQSKWLIKNIIENPEISYENKLLNCVLFRLTNKGESWETIGYPNMIKDWWNLTYEKIEKIVEKSKDLKHFLNGAYMISRPVFSAKQFLKQKGGIETDNALFAFLGNVFEYKDFIVKIAKHNPQKVYYNLKKIPPIGTFLAYQIWVDWTYIPEYPYSENEFVVSGPGCHKGIEYFTEDLDGLTDEEFMFWLRDNMQEVCDKAGLKWNPEEMFHFLPEDQRNWGVMQIENSFCEFGKYINIKNTGNYLKARKLFKPKNTCTLADW